MTLAAPLVSVCVANYRGEDVLAKCLDSILAQQCDFPFEVIVHDDASDDDSIRIVQRYASVRLIASRENVGYCAANGRMAEISLGQYLLLFNNDAWLLPGSLQALANAARSSESHDEILGLPQYNASTGGLEDRGRLCDFFLNGVPNLDATRIEVAMVAGACLWMPRKLWFDLGGFPVWFGSIAEDLYLCCAARRKGVKVRVVDAPGYFHMIGHSLGGSAVGDPVLVSTAARRFRSERNKIAVLFSCYPAPWHMVFLLLLVPSLLLEGFLLSLLRRDFRLLRKIYLSAIRDAWRRRHDILGLRERVQRQAAKQAGFFATFVWVPYKLRLLLSRRLPQIQGLGDGR